MWTFSFLCVRTTLLKMASLFRNILYVHTYSVAKADYLNVKAGGTSYHGFRGVMNILVIFYLNFQHAFDNRLFNADLVLIKC